MTFGVLWVICYMFQLCNIFGSIGCVSQGKVRGYNTAKSYKISGSIMSERRRHKNTVNLSVWRTRPEQKHDDYMYFLFVSYKKMQVGFIHCIHLLSTPVIVLQPVTLALGYILQSTHLIKMSDNCRGVNLT